MLYFIFYCFVINIIIINFKKYFLILNLIVLLSVFLHYIIIIDHLGFHIILNLCLLVRSHHPYKNLVGFVNIKFNFIIITILILLTIIFFIIVILCISNFVIIIQ